MKSYEDFAAQYAQNTGAFHPIDQAAKFITHLPKKGKILDIGCGPGRDAKVFIEQGFTVTGIDISPKMIALAKRHFSEAQFIVMDIENLEFPKNSFDGIWASASLLHIKQASLFSVLKNVWALLKSGGIFYLSVKKGSGEFLSEDKRYGNAKKFWSLFDEIEIAHMLKSAEFEILEVTCVESKSAYHTHPLIHVFCKKESQ